MTEAEEQKYRRAKEVIDEAGWVFDDFVNAETAKWLLQSVTPEDREKCFARASVAATLKVDLMNFIENYETLKKMADAKEAKNG